MKPICTIKIIMKPFYKKTIMKPIYTLLFLLILISSCSIENDVSEIKREKEKNPFLEKIIEGINTTEGISISLVDYERVYNIETEQQRKMLISSITSKNNFYFFDYNPHDKTFCDLETYKYNDLIKLKSANKEAAEEKIEKALTFNTDFLDGTIELGCTVYSINWIIQNKELHSLAIFNGNEFVYDNFISNLVTFEVKELTYKDTPRRHIITKSATSEVKSAILNGRTISADFPGGMVSRGTATVETVGTYKTECMPGGQGESYCRNYLIFADTDAHCNMIWGECDAQFSKLSGGNGYEGRGEIAYGMFLHTNNVEASISFTGNEFFITSSAIGRWDTMAMAAGSYSYSVEALPFIY